MLVMEIAGSTNCKSNFVVEKWFVEIVLNPLFTIMNSLEKVRRKKEEVFVPLDNDALSSIVLVNPVSIEILQNYFQQPVPLLLFIILILIVILVCAPVVKGVLKVLLKLCLLDGISLLPKLKYSKVIF